MAGHNRLLSAYVPETKQTRFFLVLNSLALLIKTISSLH